MTAPINTADFWITQGINAPYVDPDYPYPASVLGMTPAPLCMFRFEDELGHLKPAVDETGNSPAPANNYYTGPAIASVDGYTICDCGKAMDVSGQDACGLHAYGLPSLDHWNLTVYFEATVNTLGTLHYFFHIGDLAASNNQGILVEVSATGTLVLVWFNSVFQNVSTSLPVYAAGEKHGIGISISGGSADIYVDGVFRETLSFVPVLIQSANQNTSLGGYNQSNGPLGFCDATFDELILWTGQLNASQHQFVYNQIHTPCSVSGNCVWGPDPTWDSKNAVKSPGEIQTGDFWVVEG